MRLIDADVEKEFFCAACSTHKRYHRTIEECRAVVDSYGNKCFKMRLIDTTPTIEAEPVRHGRWVEGVRWIRKDGNKKSLRWMRCSNCGFRAKPKFAKNYCPNCGAKMVAQEVADE